MSLRISALVRSDNGGLGSLSRLFDAGLPIFKRLVLNRIHGEQGDFCRDPDERTRLVDGQITVADAGWLCDGATTVLTAETWYGGVVPSVARKRGVRTACCVMHECLPRDGFELRETDVSIAPTGLDLQVARDETPGLEHARHVMVPIPCDVERISFTQRHRAEVFVHRAGHQGNSGRNGTAEILKAWPLVKSPAKLVLYHQGGLPCAVPSDSRIECRQTNPPEYWQQDFATGDVCLHPTKWDALSLPIQEALTSGLPTIVANWWPHCEADGKDGYLPKSLQSLAVPVTRTTRSRMCREFTAHHVTPEGIAARVDALYGEDVSGLSRDARAWAEARSWSALRQQWIEALTDI